MYAAKRGWVQSVEIARAVLVAKNGSSLRLVQQFYCRPLQYPPTFSYIFRDPNQQTKEKDKTTVDIKTLQFPIKVHVASVLTLILVPQILIMLHRLNSLTVDKAGEDAFLKSIISSFVFVASTLRKEEMVQYFVQETHNALFPLPQMLGPGEQNCHSTEAS